MMQDNVIQTQHDQQDGDMHGSQENLSQMVNKDQKKQGPDQGVNIKLHSIYTTCRYAKPNPTQFREQAIVSSLFLQQLMYFNSFYCFIHGYFLYFCIFYKFKVCDNILGAIIQLVILTVWVLFEFFRLNNGYSGNINETFPEFVSFILLTIANLVLAIGYLVIGQVIFSFYFSVEIICVIIEAIFLVIQLVVCFSSISDIVKAQLLNRKYKRQKQKNIELEPVGYYEDDDDVDDTDEKKPFGRPNANHYRSQGGDIYNNQQYESSNYNPNYNAEGRNDREVSRRVPDENADPQGSNYPYQNSYNQNNYGGYRS